MALGQIFVDTVFLQALLDRRDSLHTKASKLVDRIDSTRLVTTRFVFLELCNALSGADAALRRGAVATVSNFDGPSYAISDQLFAKALALYRDREDKLWSLTDCTSFLVMQELGITEALTYDIHFVQAGFRALLRDQP